MWLRLTQATLGTSPSIWFRYLFRFVTGVSGWIWRNIQVVWSDHVFFGKRRGPRICPRGLFIMSGRRPAEREESTHPRFRRWQAHRIYFLSSIEQGTVLQPQEVVSRWIKNFQGFSSRCPAEGSVEAQMEQEVRAPWKNAPWTPLKVTEVNQIVLGGLKHVNNPYFLIKTGSLFDILALAVLFFH